MAKKSQEIDSCTGAFEPDYPMPEWRFEMIFKPDEPSNTEVPSRCERSLVENDFMWHLDFEYSLFTPSYCKRVGFIRCYTPGYIPTYRIPHLFDREGGTAFLKKHYPEAEAIRLFAK